MKDLRRDVHSAFEVITPPLGGMPERVVQTVLAEQKGRLRKERMAFRLRVSQALVAAVLIAAVGVAAVMTWNSLHNNVSPAGGVTVSYPLAQLEARPIQIQYPKTSADCNSGPYSSAGDLGSGPVYGVAGATDNSNWGTYYNNIAYADTAIDGPILVRDRDLFKPVKSVFVGRNAAGPVVGTDVVNGKTVAQHTELVLYESQASPASVEGVPHKYVWHMSAGVPNGWSGSTGWQIDGVGFTEIFYVC
ncbi:MAG TPA: hypothetical protein VGX27_11180 [Candidatus Dormibacteraeota bacterium]|nr:hypothetical protein [Candidatus Dormibacteraeota bacterium]